MDIIVKIVGIVFILIAIVYLLKPDVLKRMMEFFTDEDAALIDRHGLTPDQIKWRRAKKREMKRLFPQEYPESPTEAFLRSGHCFFDVDRLDALTPTCREPVETRQSGRLAIWHLPEPDREYVIGIDSAEGIPGRDRSAAVVVDFETGAQCARLWGYWRPHEFGQLIVKLAKAYEWAFLVPEINNHGHSTLNTILVQENYPSNCIYHRLRFDDGSAKPVKIVGWSTDAKTRPQLLDNLVEVLDTEGIEINDPEMLAECRAFNLQPSGKYEADGGKHDDLVIAWGLAYFARQTQMPYRHEPETEEVGV